MLGKYIIKKATLQEYNMAAEGLSVIKGYYGFIIIVLPLLLYLNEISLYLPRSLLYRNTWFGFIA